MTRPSEDSVEEVLARLLAAGSCQTELFEEDPAVRSFLREVVAPEATRLGLEPTIDGFGNVVVRVGPAGGPSCVLFGYVMTHPVNRMRDPLEPRRVPGDDGAVRLRGRGAAEQKGALAAGLLAAAAVKAREDELAGEFVLCVSPSGETGRHDAARAFLEHAGLDGPIRSCVVAIGTDNAICVANKGRLDVDVVVHGQAAHSSVPWQGRNAIEGAQAVLARLQEVELPGEHPELGRPTLTATAIRSWPEATHTVPDEVRLVLDRRLLPGDDPEAALADLRAACAELGDWAIDVEPGPLMHPSEVSPDDELVVLLSEALAAASGGAASLMHSHGCIDAGFFNARGIPAVMLGPGEQAMWHTDEESVSLRDVASCSAAYAAVALRQLANAD